MSHELVTKIWETELSGNCKLVALAIADMANGDSICWPSVGYLAKRCGLCLRTVERVLAELHRGGYLNREFRKGRSAVVTLTPDKLSPLTNCHPRQIVTPPPQICQDTPANLSPTPANLSPRISKESKTEPVRESSASNGKKPRSRRSQVPDTHAAWQAYSQAYEERYRQQPLRDVVANSQMARFVRRVGISDAPHIAAFFVRHNRDFYVKKAHSVACLSVDADALRVQWLNGSQITGGKARQADRIQTQGDVWRHLIDEAEQKTD